MRTCILTIGSLGDVVPYMALGRGQQENRYEVTVATLREFETVVRKHGLQHGTLRGDFLKAAQDAHPDEWESARDAELFIYNRAAIGAEAIAEKLDRPALAAFPAPLYSLTKEFPSPFSLSKTLDR